MYQITCDNYVLHDPRIEELKVIGAKCDLEINKTGALTFQIAPTHPYYNEIKKHTSEITLYEGDKVLFRGRVLNDELDFYNLKNVECEGDLSYLLDSIQRNKEYHLNGGAENVIETYLNDIVKIHNSQVEDRKKFTVGTVNITDSNNYLYKISNYDSTLSVIVDKLINTYGGYIQVRHENGKNYIDYLSELTNVCKQTIEFGKNIVDMTRYVKGEEIFTALIPLGSKLEGAEEPSAEESVENRITISELDNCTDGNIVKTDDYIYDKEAVKKYGWIWNVIKWDDVTSPQNLLSIAKNELKQSVDANVTIEMTAIDLHLLNVDIDRINVGDKIQCISLPHNLNTILIVKSMSIDIDNPANTSIKLTYPTGKINAEYSITSGNKDNEKNISYVKDTLNEGYPTIGEVNKNLNDIKNWTNDNIWGVKDWTDNQIKGVKDWANDTFFKGSDAGVNLTEYAKKNDLTEYAKSVDLTEYAKIVDVNTAFNELATALGGL